LEPTTLSVGFGVFMYLQLLLLTIEFLYVTFAGLYHFKRKTFFLFRNSSSLRSKTQKNEKDKPFNKKVVFLSVALSYFLVIYFFAVAYIFVGNFSPTSFNKPDVSLIDALYLSFTSVSVGPAGLEATSGLSKILVMMEVFVGLVYTVLIFSLIASFVHQDKVQNDNSADTNDAK
jgi:hypothetical protein